MGKRMIRSLYLLLALAMTALAQGCSLASGQASAAKAATEKVTTTEQRSTVNQETTMKDTSTEEASEVVPAKEAAEVDTSRGETTMVEETPVEKGTEAEDTSSVEATAKEVSAEEATIKEVPTGEGAKAAEEETEKKAPPTEEATVEPAADPVVMTGITAKYTGGKKTEGQSVKANEINVSAIYSDGHTKSGVTGWSSEECNQELGAGDHVFTIHYNGFTTTLTVSVSAKPQEPKPQEPKPQDPKPQDPKPQDPKPQDPKPQTPVAEVIVDGYQLAANAVKYTGLPYVYGGESLENGVDCSGFTKAIYKLYGVDLPHRASQQAQCGREVSKEEALPGDICYEVYPGDGYYSGHVGIYLGNEKMVSAYPGNPGSVVVSYCLSGFRRVCTNNSSVSSASCLDKLLEAAFDRGQYGTVFGGYLTDERALLFIDTPLSIRTAVNLSSEKDGYYEVDPFYEWSGKAPFTKIPARVVEIWKQMFLDNNITYEHNGEKKTGPFW